MSVFIEQADKPNELGFRCALFTLACCLGADSVWLGL